MANGKLLEMGGPFRRNLKSKNKFSGNNRYNVTHTSTLSGEDKQNRVELKSKNIYNSNSMYGVED